MKTWLRAMTTAVLLVVCLSGCGPVSGGSPTSVPSLDEDAQEKMATDCLDLWLNTEAPQTLIDLGMGTITDLSQPPYINLPVTQDNGVYHSHSGTPEFEDWVATLGPTWVNIQAAIVYGVGCPYDPVVKVKIEQAEQECLDIWANNEPPQAAIDAGLSTTLPDGTSVLPVITRDSAGAYHVDITADGFQDWVDGDGYFVPWDHITHLTVFGQTCPYGPSPEQTPMATAS